MNVWFVAAMSSVLMKVLDEGMLLVLEMSGWLCL